jgi:hypothetical protein
VNGKIVKIRYFILFLSTLIGGVVSAFAGTLPSKSAVMLDIVDGETAFVVDPQQRTAWWVVGQCRKSIPIQKSGKEKSNKTMTSEIISEDVQIGNRQVTLKQQFRFTLAGHLGGQYSVEVYNSLRGGWSPVPVQLQAECVLDGFCRARMEAPEC